MTPFCATMALGGGGPWPFNGVTFFGEALNGVTFFFDVAL
jgi:hypothetical protein